ncbi:MAG: tetratricopeptide repeat protein [Methylococcaceae bacterium]
MKKKKSTQLKKNPPLPIAPTVEDEKKLSALYKQGLFAEAILYAETLVARFPDYGFGWKALGAAMQGLGLTRESLNANLKAVELLPNDADAHNNLGNSLKNNDELNEAAKSYRRAFELKADFADAYYNLGSLFDYQKQFAEAEVFYKAALVYLPEKALFTASWTFALRQLCDWHAFDAQNITISNYCEQLPPTDITPFTALAIQNFSPLKLLRNSLLHANSKYKLQLAAAPLSTTIMSTHKKLRIGYLSADFCCHATVYLMAGVLENRNSELFDVYLYSYGVEQKDAQRSRVENACEHFYDVRKLSDEAIAEKILADEIDILVDLKGYTTDSRLGITALRPAPVIISWLGYPGTLGQERLADYIIGDAIVTPLEHAEHFSETLALMPHCYQPNDNQRPIGARPTREEAGLPENSFVFCTFNQAYKITPEMFNVWCRLLAAVPNSVLWILAQDSVMRENLHREMQVRGIDSTRLIFAPKMEQTLHLARLQLADLAVDTFPCTSHTTASDALWAGVPLVTKMGETFASRVAASILQTMNLGELVTINNEDYFNVALTLAQNPEKLTAIKQKISAYKNTSPLFDTLRFTKDLERLYQTIWAQEVKGERKAVVLPTENEQMLKPTKATMPSNESVAQLLALYNQGLFAEVVSNAQALVAEFPHYSFGWKALGVALQSLGRTEESLAANKKAVELQPNDAETHSNLAFSLWEIKLLSDAKKSCLRALELNPNLAAAHCNLGNVLKEQSDLIGAEKSYRRALELKPTLENVYGNLGTILCDQNKLVEAEKVYKNALHYSLKKSYLNDWIYTRIKLCDWKEITEDLEKLSILFETSPVYSCNPFDVLSFPNFNNQQALRAGLLFAEFSYKSKLSKPPLSITINHSHQKLRIGYLSADFCCHATIYLMAGILENRNSELFDVYLYSYGMEQKDPQRFRVENACEVFRNVRELSDEAIAQQILIDEIDILVDLKGYTQNARLGITALRPAPVIVSWLGYPGSLGHERLADYIIGDAIVTPIEHAEHFSETLALMPHCYQPNDNQRPIGICPTREEAGLPENSFVFCTFNQSYKITPEMFTLWCRLLVAVPNSVLWILAQDSVAQENLRHEMQARGVDSMRLIFAPKMEQTAHLARLQLADLAVDTFPYTSHTTASDALWAGVPLVTKMGETFASRVAASILQTMDLAELVTENDDDYFNVALTLAQKSEKLTAIKQKISVYKNTSPLFDTPRFTRNLERLYQEIWKQELKGERKAIVLEDNNDNGSIMKSTLATTASIDEESQLLAFYNQGLFEEAVKYAVTLLTRFPDYGFGWKALGAALVSSGRFNEALAANRKNIELTPDDADAHYNLGNTLKTLTNLKEAEICYRNAIFLNPNFDKAYCNLGIILKDQGKLEEATSCYLKALAINPDFDRAYSNLSIVLKEQGKLEESEKSCRRALKLNPKLVEAHYNLGNTLNERGLLQEAEQCYRQAIAIKSDYANAYYNLGNLLRDQKRLIETAECYENALRCIPQNKNYLLAWIFIRRHLCEWRTEDQEKLAVCFDEGQTDVANPFMLLALQNFTPQHISYAGQLFSDYKYHANLITAPLSTKIIHSHQKLRIGYLSADLHSHATVYLIAGILENRNTAAFDVYLYSYGAEYKDEQRSRVEEACEVFRNVRELSDEAIAQQILADEIDILVDLKGYTQNTRLGITALRPAPVIISWLGYPATLGNKRLADYIIGDATVTPLKNAEHFSETLALMPHCYQPNDNQRPIGARPTREEVGLPENAFVFCTFNQSYKITPEMFGVWCRLLDAVPNSVLWMLTPPHEVAQENLRREMEARNVDSSRLIFAPKMEQTAHLGRLQLADLAVDTFPYTSHTTASDALWAGVPLVTKLGETFASCVAASILRTMDLAELVTEKDDDYFNVTLSLAQNPEKFAAIKQKIAIQKQISPLFDTPRFARDLERLYQTIWAQELKGERKAVVLESETKPVKLEFHPQFITDENAGNKFVILPYAEWQQILKTLKREENYD